MRMPADSFGLRGRPLRDLQRYLEAEWRGGDAPVMRADAILALLRLGHLREAESLLGKPITRCPSGVPKWPPDPIPDRFRKPVVTRVAKPNPCAPRSDAHRRFAQVRVGLTRDQLTGRGIDRRDIRVWTQRGWMEMGKLTPIGRP